jgi:hypothetical protein
MLPRASAAALISVDEVARGGADAYGIYNLRSDSADLRFARKDLPRKRPFDQSVNGVEE